jgi:SAM-dependent methyltransferase
MVADPPEPASEVGITRGYNRHSRSVLNTFHQDRFPGETLFARLARTVCAAECLPRKELYEAWEVARRVRRRFRGGPVVDLACGHGLLAWILLLLDDTSPRATGVDRSIPKSAARLERVLTDAWPRLAGRVELLEADVADAPIPDDALVVSVHACGGLTDLVLQRAIAARVRVAVLPCCHALRSNDSGHLEGWMDGPLAIDATRAARLREAGYRIWTQTIPDDITPKNRLLIGEPQD